jgi:hypothetical protein
LVCFTSLFSSNTGFYGVFFSTASAFGPTAYGVFEVGADVEGIGPFGPWDKSATSFKFNFYIKLTDDSSGIYFFFVFVFFDNII